MTLKELSEKIHRSESTIQKEFPRTQAYFEKLGIIITKQGRGKKAQYFISYKEE